MIAGPAVDGTDVTPGADPVGGIPGRQAVETLALLETLHSKAPVGFGFVDLDFRIVRLNEMLATIQGSTIAEQIGRTIAEVVPQVWARLEPTYRHVLATGEAVLNVELEAPPTPGHPAARHWLVSHYPVSVDDRMIGIGIVVIDITERKQAEGVRRQLAAIVEGSGDAIFSVDGDGLVLTWNSAAERLFGYAADEIIGRPVSLITSAELVGEQVAMRARLAAGSAHEQLETTRRRKDGSLVDVIITASTATDEAGRILGLSVVAHDITERRKIGQALEASRRRLAEAQRIAQLGSFELDLLTGEMIWSDELSRQFGFDADQVATPGAFLAMIDHESRAELDAAWDAAVTRGIAFELLCRMTPPGSEPRWLMTRGVPLLGGDGEPVKLLGTVRDATERVEAERVRRLAETRFETGFVQGGIGVAILGLDGIAIRVNPAVVNLLGRGEDELVGRSWTPYNHPADPPPGPFVMARIAAGYDTAADERRYIQPDGTVVWASTHLTLVRDEAREPQYYLVQLQDITERKRMEQELSHQALHDTLTGLPNRALLTDRLVHGLAAARRTGSRLGVIFLDVDHFKVVNDSLGHSSGDNLLISAADRIGSTIRPADTVARFGGDEFVVVCDGVSAEETIRIAERVLHVLSEPFDINGHRMSVTASAGIAIADVGATAESLLRDSDTAMYRAKERGRGRVEVFDDALRAKAERRLAIASALRHALERGEFSVHYQPIVDLATGSIVSAEALLRWRHPEHGLIGPDEFIPLAEETGLIVGIGAWVLEQACREVVGWQVTHPAMTVAVNLSVRQMLAPDITGTVKDVLHRTGVHAASLWLELTESVFMADVDYFARTMASLRAMGVRLSIDDFGTGYSSLSYLQRFPVDAVKVDRAFVDALGQEGLHSGLVSAIVAMAKALDLQVVAEGVETQAQLVSLTELRCDRAQGYYLARPMPAEDFRALLAAARRWPVATTTRPSLPAQGRVVRPV